MSNEITLIDVLNCFKKLKEKGWRGLRFVLWNDSSGSIRNEVDNIVIAFDDLEHFKKILINMEILKKEAKNGM